MSEIVTSRFPDYTGWPEFFVCDDGTSSEQIINSAGLDWTVSLRNTYYDGNNPGEIHVDKSYKRVIRDTDGAQLGMVKRGYKPIQNRDAFLFLDSLANNGSIKYHSAGTFNDGKRVWMLAKIGDSEILPKDILEHYILMYNSHDGSSALTATAILNRIACYNAVMSALRTGQNIGVKIKHTMNAYRYLDDARNILQEARIAAEEASTLAKHLTKISIPASTFTELTHVLFPNPPDDVTSERRIANAEEKRAKLIELYYQGKGQDIPGVAGTGWGAYNAVTEYVNHIKPVRGDDRTKRLENTLFGDGARLISRARKLILQAA